MELEDRVRQFLEQTLGAMGVPLTPERSVAVDPAVVPLGAPVFISSVGGGAGAFRRLLAAGPPLAIGRASPLA